MTTASEELLHYRPIKEGRGSYFVEYRPPSLQFSFARLDVVYTGSVDTSCVLQDLQKEAVYWLRRYDVPIMASAWDAAENLIYPHGNYDDSFLYAWRVPETNELASTWKQGEVPEVFGNTSNNPDWRTIYRDLPFRTDSEVKAAAEKERSQRRKGLLIWKIILTLCIKVTAVWAIVQFLGPGWLAFLVLAYSLDHAFREWQKMMGYAKPSRADGEKAAKELKMNHYFYHCEKNPEGFGRLKCENFERDARERTRREADELAKIPPAVPSP